MVLAGDDARVELLEHAARKLAGRLGAVEDDDVAVRVRLDAEAILDQRQMAVVFSEKAREVPVVLERHHDAPVGDLDLSGPARSGDRVPAKCCQSVLPTSIASNRHFSPLSLAYCARHPMVTPNRSPDTMVNGGSDRAYDTG